jgi:hypothetical protein
MALAQQSTSETAAFAGFQQKLLAQGYVPQTGYDEKVAVYDALAANVGTVSALPASLTQSISPSALATGPSIGTQTSTGWAGLLVGDRIVVTPPGNMAAATAIGGAWCAVAGTLSIAWICSTGTPTPTSGVYTVTIFRS